jgi:NodT family efflux transporter outer membrane factor (OMF) lipoprotein
MKRLAAVALLLPAACAVGPDYEAPSPSVPAAYSGLEAAGEGERSRAKAEAADLAAWWNAFRDPALVGLVERAVASNLDLRAAAARVREARGVQGIAYGGLLPVVGVGASYVRQRWSENGAFPTNGEAFGQLQAGFDASWEIDVFGGRRRDLEAADADFDAAVEGLRDVRVSVIAELARAYVDLRGAQARLDIARRNLDAQRRTAEIVRARLDAGQTTELDVARAEAQVQATASFLPAFETAARVAAHAIALLLAKPPGELLGELSAAGPLPAAPAEIPIGLPTDLLRRRPDLRRSERELAAATARIGVATADLYPRFFIAGSFGTDSVTASDLFTAASRSWSFGPAIRWSLFQGGRIRANIEVQNARQEQAILRFEQTLLGALRDVEDALVAHAREQRRRASLAQAVALQQRSVELADQRYLQGLVDFLSVVDAQRALFLAQDALVQSEQAIASNTIALYKALGGGWSPDDERRAP